MGIIAWIIIGLLAGAIAKALMPGKDPGGIIITMLIGIAGGLLGGWLGKVVFGVDSIDGFFDISDLDRRDRRFLPPARPLPARHR